MEELNLQIEELEERIAPDCFAAPGADCQGQPQPGAETVFSEGRQGDCDPQTQQEGDIDSQEGGGEPFHKEVNFP